jgi:Ca-activated chloride channel family protein
VDSIIRQSNDQAAIITFSDHATLEQALTNDLTQLREAIARVEFKPPPGYLGGGQYAGKPPSYKSNQPPPPGSTTIWDTVWSTSDKLLSQTSDKSRRAIIILTDGVDTGSHKKMAEAIDRALKINATIYTIGIGDEEYGGVDRGPLQKLAERTGGRAFVPKIWNDVKTDFEEIEQELDSQYVISYSPTKKNEKDEIHKVRIEIINPELRKQGLRLLHQQSYSTKRW